MASESMPSLEIDMGTSGLPGRGVLDIATIRSLSQRTDLHGFLRMGTHLAVIAGTGTLVWFALSNPYLLIPVMIMHGFAIVTMFAPMHECVHRTAFATPMLNEVFGWIAGLLSFYNFTYYRYYHTWHHRYTQDTERDPELMSPKPRNLFEYLIEISGLSFWLFRPMTFARLALGQTQQYPFVPETARRKIAVSASLQLAAYVAAIGAIALGNTSVLYFFVLPVILGQPLLRAILLAEHTGCSDDENGLTNTRTTLTSFPVRLLMWDMSFHTEHHLYPSIPFHQLPRAHVEIQDKLLYLEPNYVAANRTIIRSLGTRNQEGTS